MKKTSLITTILILQSCLLDPHSATNYSNKISKIRNIKLSEKVKKSFDGNTEPDWPIDNSDLHGTDSNENGIRDDIEIYINRIEKNADIRKALKLVAKYNRASLIAASENNYENLIKMQKKLDFAQFCYSFLNAATGNNGSARFDDILDFHLNTTERETLHIKMSKMLGGYETETGISLIEGYKACEFEIDDSLKNTLRNK